MPLGINLPTDFTAGESAHVAAHEATNAAVNATAAVVDTLEDAGATFLDARLGAGDGSTTVQTISSGSFTTVGLNTEVVDDDAAFSTSTSLYTVPAAGLYTIVARIRVVDNQADGRNVGLGVHTSNIDGQWFQWYKVAAPASGDGRWSANYVRTARFEAGDQLRLYAYAAGASLPLNSAQMTIVAGGGASGGTGLGWLNVKNFGAVGDGTTNDATAITNAATAVTDGSVLYFPPGRYRFATVSPASGAAILISGKSRVSVWFAPGAELVMDNLSAGSGTSHGVAIVGGCSDIHLENVTVRWATAPSTRSLGDGFYFRGYPSDSTPAGGWLGSTGAIYRVRMTNCRVRQAPQTGAVFMGCSDVQMTNFRAEYTLGDGLHFNACRSVDVNGHAAVGTGDDGLAFVTYQHATDVWQDATNGPFNRPALDEWSNSNSTANGVSVAAGDASGLRISGGYQIAVTNLAVDGATTGIIADSAIVGTGIAWAYHASKTVTVSNAVVQGCQIGIRVPTQNVTSSSAAAFYEFDVALSDITVRDCSNWSIRTEGDGSTSSIVSGVHFDNIRVVPGTGGGGSGGIAFQSLRNSSIRRVRVTTTAGNAILIAGQDSVHTGALSALPRHNLVIDDITNVGGQILIQDLHGASIGRLSSLNSTGTGVEFLRTRHVTVSDVRVVLPHRANTGTSRGLLVTKAAHLNVGNAVIDHDANTSGTWTALEIGGGDATDPAGNGVRLERITYTNTINGSGSNITVQGGSFQPINYLYRMRHYNGGEASPVWRAVNASLGAGAGTLPDL